MTHFLTGLVAAPFTAFHGDGTVNLTVIEHQAAALANAGVTGAFVCGTTGEYASLTVDERMIIARRWVDVAEGTVKVIVHVGDNCQANAETLAAHANRIGADAIGAMAPYFFKPTVAGQIVDYLAPVAAKAPALPFYYYHIPSMTGVTVPAPAIIAVASKQIPTFAGVKFTDSDIPQFRECVTFHGGRYDALFGRDELLIDGLAAGACGAIGSTYNFVAPHFLQLVRAFQRGDIARATSLQLQATALIDIVYGTFGGLPAAKGLMAHLGIDCGPVRPPLIRFLSGELDRLLTTLNGAGYDDRFFA
ncbi:MAG TPA: dihydrodipicolinate synthase family protein [Capsulimonadaceae bacterium]|jgi:N-acetylneuraminate lyase